MKTTKLIFKLFLLSLVFVACNEDDSSQIEDILERFEDGIIVSAEGNFGNKDGSLSFITSEYSVSTNFLYKAVNGTQLGGLIQSITFNENDAYIVLNDANSIVVVDRYTFLKKAVITTGLENPRYMTVLNGKGYVTNWGDAATETDDYVAVLNLETNRIDESSHIALDNGVERIISKNNKLFVSHKGGWSSNKIISVIEVSDNSVSKITVNDNPDTMFFIASGELVVLCKGKPLAYGGAPDFDVSEATTSSISFIDVSNNTVTKSLEFAENVVGTHMSHDGNNIYYYSDTDNLVYKISESATELASDGIDVGEIYGMTVKNNLLYTVENSFSELSKLDIIDYESDSKLYSTAVGLGASKIYFNE
jgi:hypothetical protein